MRIKFSLSQKSNKPLSHICLLYLLALTLSFITNTAFSENSQAVLTAYHTKNALNIDGHLNEKIWQSSQIHSLYLNQQQTKRGEKMIEPASVQLAWNKYYLYLAIKSFDSEMVAKGNEDNLHHYQLGDVIEIFLKPKNKPWYWELYATPKSKKTSFWQPERRKIMIKEMNLEVAVNYVGTINNAKDKDHYWIAEIAIPIKELMMKDKNTSSKLNPLSNWNILIARYNYNDDFSTLELSSNPMLSKLDFHLYEEYATLKLLK